MSVKKIIGFTIGSMIAVAVGCFVLSRLSFVRGYLGLGTPATLFGI